MTQPQGSSHLPSLDGFRGIAVLLVIGYHLLPHAGGVGPLMAVLTVGWTGVDLFFSLSGFLITGILYDTLGQPDYFKVFYARRALRLLPIYVVFVAVTLLIADIPAGYGWEEAAIYFSYLSNVLVFFVPEFPGFKPVQTGHIWSLHLEEQFYLLWPAAVALLGTRRRILIACLAGSVFALGLRLWVSSTSLPPGTCYLQLPTRLDGLLLGGAVAMWVRAPNADIRGWRIWSWGIAIVMGICFILLAASIGGFHFARPPVRTWGFACTAIGSAALLVLALIEGTWLHRACCMPILRTFGKYSYGLYLLHSAGMEPFKAWRHEVTEALGSVYLGALICFVPYMAVVFGLEWTLYRVLERPFLRLKKHFPYEKTTSPLPANAAPASAQG